MAKALWFVFNLVLQAKTSLNIDCHKNSNEFDLMHAALHCCCNSNKRGKSLGGIISCPSDLGASAKSFMMVEQETQSKQRQSNMRSTCSRGVEVPRARSSWHRSSCASAVRASTWCFFFSTSSSACRHQCHLGSLKIRTNTCIS